MPQITILINVGPCTYMYLGSSVYWHVTYYSCNELYYAGPGHFRSFTQTKICVKCVIELKNHFLNIILEAVRILPFQLTWGHIVSGVAAMEVLLTVGDG